MQRLILLVPKDVFINHCCFANVVQTQIKSDCQHLVHISFTLYLPNLFSFYSLQTALQGKQTSWLVLSFDFDCHKHNLHIYQAINLYVCLLHPCNLITYFLFL